ncbi:MAG: DUF6580 family putative transport protein [Patescibacteria group bacterium]
MKMIPIFLITLGVASRLLDHPANVAPIGAIAIFGALYLPRRFALVLPLAALFLSDIIIGFYTPLTMASVYGSFLLMGGIGLWIRKNKSFSRVIGGTILGSFLFFLITNWAVWAFDGMYPLTFAGLLESYAMAIPFFRNSLIGDLFFTGVLVGSMETIMYVLKKRSSSDTNRLLAVWSSEMTPPKRENFAPTGADFALAQSATPFVDAQGNFVTKLK